MLVVCKILGLFVNTLTEDEKYSLLYRDNLTQPIQILLYQKRKTFSQLSSKVLKPTLNFEHVQKKDDPHSRSVPKLPSLKKVIK